LKLRLKKILALLIILSVAGLLSIHFYVPRFITEVKNPILDLARGEYVVDAYFEDDKAFTGKMLSIPASDGIVLSAYLTYPETDTTKGTIILLHGIRSRKEHFVPVAKFLAENGYNSLAVDLRAHGASTGKYCTFGVKEKFDIQSVIDHLEKEEKIQYNLGIWGQSLGAAIALQSMAIDDRIQFGVIESTFSSFRIIAHDYFIFHLGFEIPPLTDYLIDRAGKISDFDPDEAIPKKYCQKIQQRILVVHGDQDQRINIKYGRENFESISSVEKQFLTIENAAHLNVWQVGGDQYFHQVLNFIESQ
jgi:pimeloyl-ACP methyl ester carboxylesterase